MTNQEVKELRDRIDKGIAFFGTIKPSQWKPEHKLWLTRFLEMLKKYMEWRDGEILYLKEKQALDENDH